MNAKKNNNNGLNQKYDEMDRYVTGGCSMVGNDQARADNAFMICT